MAEDAPRTRSARAAAERALIRVVHHYGQRPEFVLLGGLVPDLLCSTSGYQHSGTTDVDVQVDLEIAAGSINTAKLEQALLNSEFEADPSRVWRWKADGPDFGAVVKFELLSDLDTERSGVIVEFDGCEALGAINLRGTGFAARDSEVRKLTAHDGGVEHTIEINVAGIAGFLLAKASAAHSRRKPKDWYDIAYVLLNNDIGGVEAAAGFVRDRFNAELAGVRTPLDDLRDNFADVHAQGANAYADEMSTNHPELDHRQVLADGVTAVRVFHDLLVG